MKPFRIVGHRGARGILPENTMAGFKRALELGVDALDVDVTLAARGVVIAYHDLMLNPAWTLADGAPVREVPLAALDYAALQRLDVGSLNPSSPYAWCFPDQRSVPESRIPRLEQVLELAGDRADVQIEMKSGPGCPPEELAEALARVLRNHPQRHRCEVQAFDWRCLLELRRRLPDVRLQFLSTEPPDLLQLAALGAHAWGVRDTQLSRAELEQAHSLGMQVLVWEWPDDPDNPQVPWFPTPRWLELLDWGVDGIIHDRPDLVLAWRAAQEGGGPL